MCPGDPLGDHGQRAIALALVLEPVFVDEDRVGVSVPLAHQGRASLQYETRIDGKSAFLDLSGQGPEASPQRGAQTTMGALLQLIGEGSDQQIATEAQRWPGAMQIAPGKPQIVCRPIDQFGNFDVDRGPTRLSCSIVPLAASTGHGRRPASVLASRSIVGRGFHALPGAAMR